MTKQNQPVPSAEQQTKYWLEQNGYPELENIFHLFVEGPITRERLNGLLAPMFTRHAQLCVSAAVEAERERANKMQAALEKVIILLERSTEELEEFVKSTRYEAVSGCEWCRFLPQMPRTTEQQ